MMEKSNAEKEKVCVPVPEEEEKEDKDIEKECKQCGNHPCVGIELEPMLSSILQTYGDWKTNKQVRYIMYGDAVAFVYGRGLGPKVRRKLPECVSREIKEMCPDENDEYTGFIATKSNK